MMLSITRLFLIVCLLWSTSASSGLSLEVEGHGSTFERAKDSAFRKAIEQAVGAVIVSDQEVSNKKLTKDFIGSYSAGFIDTYQIIDSFQDASGMWTVNMTVSVATSKIADRMRSRSQDTFNINGNTIADSIDTQLEMLANGDQLLKTVLTSYPQNAYVINSGQTEFQLNKIRQPYVDIPYEIKLSQHWVEAFEEAVRHVAVEGSNCNTLTMSLAQAVQDGPRNSQTVKDWAKSVCSGDPDIRIFYKKPKDFFPKSYNYYLPDQTSLDTINQQLRTPIGIQHIGLMVELIDYAGVTFDQRCANIDNYMFIFYSGPRGTYNLNQMQKLSRPNIMGQNRADGILRVNLKTTEQIENLARIRLSVQRTCS